MAFMQPQVYHGLYYRVETSAGTEIVPGDVHPGAQTAEDLRDYLEGVPADAHITLDTGFLARLSAPGYMDCTSWTAHASEEEAREYLRDMYGDDEEGDSNEE